MHMGFETRRPCNDLLRKGSPPPTVCRRTDSPKEYLFSGRWCALGCAPHRAPQNANFLELYFVGVISELQRHREPQTRCDRSDLDFECRLVIELNRLVGDVCKTVY